MTGDTVSGFDDEVIVLDVQGNIQNAVVLATRLRTRPFTTSSGTVSDQDIWRVDRWQWESPTENEWIPWDKQPYYALHRERFSPKEYRAPGLSPSRAILERYCHHGRTAARRPRYNPRAQAIAGDPRGQPRWLTDHDRHAQEPRRCRCTRGRRVDQRYAAGRETQGTRSSTMGNKLNRSLLGTSLRCGLRNPAAQPDCPPMLKSATWAPWARRRARTRSARPPANPPPRCRCPPRRSAAASPRPSPAPRSS